VLALSAARNRKNTCRAQGGAQAYMSLNTFAFLILVLSVLVVFVSALSLLRGGAYEQESLPER
jgi:hypothetical protein